MSSGFGPIAGTKIKNGSVWFRRVWGDFCPDDEHGVELTVEYSAHGPSDDNIHAEPVKRKIELFLTEAELLDLSAQLLVRWDESQRSARGEANPLDRNLERCGFDMSNAKPLDYLVDQECPSCGGPARATPEGGGYFRGCLKRRREEWLARMAQPTT